MGRKNYDPNELNQKSYKYDLSNNSFSSNKTTAIFAVNKFFFYYN